VVYFHFQATLDKILATFKIDAPFFETQSLTYPEDLVVPDASDDLKRELELQVFAFTFKQTPSSVEMR
jgi:hypothetical protein